MHQLKIQQIDCRACHQEMLEHRVGDLANDLHKTEHPRDLVRVCIKNNDEPGEVEDQEEIEPSLIIVGLLKRLNDKVPRKVQCHKKAIQDEDIA